jgi:HK97 gp10 family phage protein
MSDYEYVIGLDDCKRDLLGLSQEIVEDLFPAALAAGGDVIEQELEARTPEDPDATSAKKYGTLRDDLDTKIETDGRRLTGNAKVGFKRKAYVARFLEYGHRNVTHKDKQVGATPANPFMRTAAEASADGAVEAFADSLGEK